MKRTIAVTLMTLLGSASAFAEASEELVQKLFGVTNIEKQMLGGFETMMPMVNRIAKRFSLDAGEKKKLKAIYRTWYKEDLNREKLADQLAGLYQTTFTDEELRKMIEFYSSPTGKKVVTETPELMQKASRLGRQEAKSKQDLLMKRLKPFLQKHRGKRRSPRPGQRPQTPGSGSSAGGS